MNIAKYFTILFINIFLFLILFFIIDVSVYYSQLYISWRYEPTVDDISYIKHITRPLNNKHIYDVFFIQNPYQPEQNVNMQDQAYVLMGCSFTDGSSLKKNFSYQLAEATNHPVYNRASGGWGTQHMLYQLQQDKFYEIIKQKEEPPIFIYTYIDDHVNRIHRAMAPVIFGGNPTFTYEVQKKNNDVTLVIPKINEIIYRFPLLSLIKEKFYSFKQPDEKAELLKLHIVKSKEEIDKRYDNSKFIIIIFYGDYHIYSIANDLQKYGIDMLSYEETTNLNLNDTSTDIFLEDGHPNEKAWEIFIPHLLSYLSADVDQKKLKDRKTNEYIKNQLQNRCKERKNANDIINEITSKYDPSLFSLAYSDNVLKQKGETTAFKSKSAYVFWCFANLFKDNKVVSMFFIDLSIKLNPNQVKYKHYKQFILSEEANITSKD